MPPPPSASAAGGGTSLTTAYAKTETGCHVLKVEGYSQIKGVLCVGKRIQSGTFNVGGYSWCITCLPDGYDDENADWICVDLCLLDNPPFGGEIKVRVKFSLLDPMGEPESAHTRNSSVWTFSATDTARGFHHFIKKTLLESSYLSSDSFKIRCDVTVVKKICTETITNTVCVAVPSPNLPCHAGALLDSKVGCDVIFDVDGEQFTAHRIVLAARSPVFMAEFFGPMKETATSVVRIDDLEARVFKVLLHFIYTDSLPEIEEGDNLVMAQHLLVVADKYNMERLEMICEEMLCKYVDLSLVVTTLVLAEQHGCDCLKVAGSHRWP